MEVGVTSWTVVALLEQFAEASRAVPVDLVLVLALQFVERVPEDLALFSCLGALRLGEALVKHVLVVLDKNRVLTELVVETVLRVRQQVTFICERRCVRRPTIHLRCLVVLAQVRVKGALTVSWAVVGSQSAGRVGNVGVTTPAVVDVNDWLRVDMRQVVRWPLLLEHKRPYRRKG